MFEKIRPYNDEKVREVISAFAKHPIVSQISDFLYPGQDHAVLQKTLSEVNGVFDFQQKVMYPAIGQIVKATTGGLTYDGIGYFRQEKSNYLIVSNHRDIVLDSAFLQYIMRDNDLPTTEIAVGNNLLAIQFVADLMLSNRMIEVVRDGSPRDVYRNSCHFSDYIRRRITGRSLDSDEGMAEDGGASIWLAQRQGRTKDGFDMTEQGILKMLDVSGTGGFADAFEELRILPMSISYEYEPCGVQKALECWRKSRFGAYTKAEMEDVHSMLSGIMQNKGRVHISLCEPLTREELETAASRDRNERYRKLAEIIDKKIIDGYHLWDTSRYAAEILDGKKSNPEFEAFIEEEISSLPKDCDHDAIRKNLLTIYAVPYLRKNNLQPYFRR